MTKAKMSPANMLAFFKLAEKLKTILRHSWTSSGRQESVAEHTWMMMLLAMTVMPQLDLQMDQEKVLKMIVLHDLAESLTDDMPVWEGVKKEQGKLQAERKAMMKILEPLDKDTAGELLEIWEEYESRESLEAKFVKVIDTLDVVAQHNAADISSWDDNDYLWQLSPLQDNFFDLNGYLRKIKVELDKWTIEKVKTEGNLKKLDQQELAKRAK